MQLWRWYADSINLPTVDFLSLYFEKVYEHIWRKREPQIIGTWSNCNELTYLFKVHIFS